MEHDPFTCLDVACAACHGLEPGPTDADLAVTARRGGRIITDALGRFLADSDRGAFWIESRRILSGEVLDDPQPTLAWLWDSKIGTRERLAELATMRDVYFGPTYERPEYGRMTQQQAEAMTTWPIVEAAYGRPASRARLSPAQAQNPWVGIEQYQAEDR